MLHYIILLVSLFPMIGVGVLPEETSEYLSIITISLYAIYVQTKNWEKYFSLSKSEIIWILFIVFHLLLGYTNDQIRLNMLLSIISSFVLYYSVRRISIKSKQLYIALAFIGSIIAIIAIYQFLHGLILFHRITPIHAFFDNPAGMAATLLVTFPFAIYVVLKKYSLPKYIGLCSIVLIFTALILSQSRAAFLGAIVCSSLMFRKEITLRIQNKKYYILSAFIVVILFIGLYIFKKDSANGRVLIWKCCLEMINDNVLLGGGPSAFSKSYMTYQADYFKNNPTSEFMRNADEIKFAQNHILEFLVNYGIIGVLIVCLLISLVIREYKRSHLENKSIYLSMLGGILIMSCFSYPLNYVFVVNTIIILLGILMRDEISYNIHINHLAKAMIFTICLAFICLGTTGVVNMIDETKWKKIAAKAEVRQTESLLAEYKELLPRMRSNHYFLYNISYTLRQMGKYKESINMLNECTKFSNDYNIQLLYAENYKSLEMTSTSLEHLQFAHQMIPIRFIPLYKIFLIQKENNNVTEANILAKELLEKKVKINSIIIEKIKLEAKTYLSPGPIN